ncbi:hypothetical protein L207DRAFT_133926 [Hyaloscypha variabilis F]|uniref:Uncharacterized protein n=1 Tax=Hyaloscypha variabilis (strain UAMH 11265 / GT02V1 / F) TaxID=1149755 RepID=A0A2J6R689_HYAVF|nr:hypothetical protein L207DRAFT_133926 [Hyaloscypha variabilis F]
MCSKGGACRAKYLDLLRRPSTYYLPTYRPSLPCSTDAIRTILLCCSVPLPNWTRCSEPTSTEPLAARSNLQLGLPTLRLPAPGFLGASKNIFCLCFRTSLVLALLQESVQGALPNRLVEAFLHYTWALFSSCLLFLF